MPEPHILIGLSIPGEVCTHWYVLRDCEGTILEIRNVDSNRTYVKTLTNEWSLKSES